MDGANEKFSDIIYEVVTVCWSPISWGVTAHNEGQVKHAEFQAELTAYTHYCINVNPTYRYVQHFIIQQMLKYTIRRYN